MLHCICGVKVMRRLCVFLNYAIHINDHHGIKPHYHPWQDGHPVRTLNKKGKYENEGRPLDKSKAKILHKVRNYGR